MLLRRTLLLLTAVFAASISRAQTPPSVGANASAALAAYDVVSVKPVQPSETTMMMGGRQVRMRTGVGGVQDLPDGIRGDSVTAASLLQSAYAGWALPIDDTFTGLPDWVKTDHFSVQAKMSPEQMAEFSKLSKDEQQQRRLAMLQALLADRFKLKVRRETRQVPDYELVVAKGGPKMKEAAADTDAAKVPDGKQFKAFLLRGISKSGAQEWTGTACSMEQLSGSLRYAPGMDRRVVDKTGLPGKYDFTLNFATSTVGVSTDAPAPDDLAPSMFTALEDQLGLRLQRGVATADVVVVEHMERPAQD